jgi:broad specificity phosphatase PhoE
MITQLILVRHGQTKWSATGKHTSVTDIDLDSVGIKQAKNLAEVLRELSPSAVFSSPLQRATQTCELCGFKKYEILNELTEWNYGKYEGLTSDEIKKIDPNWSLFVQGTPGGEKPEDVYLRAQQLIRGLLSLDGTVICFSHGHISRVIASCWINQPVILAKHLFFEAAHFGILSYEHNWPCISAWNITHFQ